MAVDKNKEHWKNKIKQTSNHKNNNKKNPGVLYDLISKNPYLLRFFFLKEKRSDHLHDNKLVFLIM